MASISLRNTRFLSLPFSSVVQLLLFPSINVCTFFDYNCVGRIRY